MKSLVATLVLLLGTAFAEEDLAALVRDLGSEDFATRDAATQRLTEVGEAARALLEEARSSPDAEVRMRATRILALLDTRRVIDAEYETARKAFSGDSPEDAARRVWLDVLYLAARGEEGKLAPLIAPGGPAPSFWASARGLPLSTLVDLSWVEVIPSRRLGWLECEFGPKDVLVVAAVPTGGLGGEVHDGARLHELRALSLSPSGSRWKVRQVVRIDSDLFIPYEAEAPTDRDGREWAVGVQTVSLLASGASGVSCYRLAQALDGVGDFEAAIRAFERCQSTGQWPDYCIVHRYFDLMRLGRREDAVRVLGEEPGAGSCAYIGKVAAWLRGELKTEDVLEYAQKSGAYEAESVHYYLGMERLLAGDLEAAKAHLARCAAEGGGCYERTFAADVLWLLKESEARDRNRGEGH